MWKRYGSKMLLVLSCLLLVQLFSIVTDTSAQTVGERMAEEARELVDAEYRFGGTSPSAGFDTSGLLYYLHDQEGIRIPRTVKNQARQGTTVSFSNLIPGDSVFFKDSNGNASIASIYIGNDQVISSTPSRGGVQIIALNTQAARDQFMVAKRYFDKGESSSNNDSGAVDSGSLSPESPASSVGADIIDTAEKYLGTPYRFGASRGSGYFDCSLLTQQVFRENGITLPRNSRQQSRVGSFVSWGEWEVGDLLFFWTRATGEGTVGHVAIYAGDDQIIHTWGSPGVTYNNINERAWRDTYMGARRVID